MVTAKASNFLPDSISAMGRLTSLMERPRSWLGPNDLPGQIWSRVNVRLDRNQGGQGHAQETVYARRDYSTSANG